jgi:tetratricopeptide (TPR) repeat protein
MKRFVVCLLLGVSCVVGTLGTFGPAWAGRAADVRTEAFQNLAQGVAAYKRGEYPLAAEKLRLSAGAALNSFRAHYYLGLALIGDRRYDEALEALDVALDLDPGHLQSHVATGDAHLKMGDLGEAQAAYFRALELRPAYPNGLDGLGRIYEAKSKDAKAIEQYKAAIASNRGYAQAYTHLGDLYLRQQRFEEAVMLLEEAVSIRPDYAPGLNRLALAYGKLGLDNQAVATIQRAIELEPKSANHPATLGELQLVKGFVASAEQSFREALKLDPALPEARLGLAEVARRRGLYDDAVFEIDAALVDDRIDAASVQRLNDFRKLVLSEQERFDLLEARVASEEAAPADYGDLARVFAGRGMWSPAADLLTKAPESPEREEQMAYMLFKAGRFAEAHALYDGLASSSGRTDLALNNGVSMALLGDDRGAVEAYRLALDRNPDHRHARLYLGNALLRLGKPQEAVEAYLAFLKQSSRGESAERIRRILKQISPGSLPKPPPPVAVPDQAASDETPASAPAEGDATTEGAQP